MFFSVGSINAAGSGYIYPDALRFGALNALHGVNIADVQVAIEMNFDRLSQSYNNDLRAKLVVVSDAEEAAHLIQQKKIHALSLPGIDFILLNSLVALTPLAVASKLDVSPLEPYVLLTSKGITLDQLAALDRRRLIVESNHRWDIGRIWLETVLHDKGYAKSASFFTSVQVASKPTRMILPVFFGQAEACLVPKSAYDTMVEYNPQVGEKLNILMRSPGFAKNLICSADFLDPGLVDEIRTSLIKMHTTEEGRQLMMIFQLRRNFAFKPEYLIETGRIFERYRKIQNVFE